jgi:PEP-CTERM motif
MKISTSSLAVLSLAALAAAPVTHASLALNYQFNGHGNWSIDGVGSNNSPTGIVQAYVPVGSTIEKAFLYTTLTPSSSFTSINFDGTTLNSGSFTGLGSNPYGLQGYRADVTSLVSAKVGGGSASRFDFLLNESPTSPVDGSALVVVYSNPSDSERTIALLDGYSVAAGDSFTVNLGTPLPNPTTPGFEALFSLGVGYSYQVGSSQFSYVDVDGRRLTSWAGGEDDGGSYNGGLVTVGGLDDSASNPADPTSSPVGNFRYDDELYNLALGNSVNSAPFLSTGMTSFNVSTRNPSGDDNIFFAGLNLTARAGVNQPPPPPIDGSPVPEPSTYGLIGAAALLGLIVRRRIKK